MAKTAAVLLSGSGVYDGSEIHESVLTLLSLEKAGLNYKCFAPNKPQMHVINHLNGEEMDETRNVLIESARIARGDIQDIKDLPAENFDVLVLPGGFGTAKNHTDWAVNGPDGEIDADVQKAIRSFHALGKPIVAFCMAPTTLAKAFQDSDVAAELSVGNTSKASPYEIDGIGQGMESVGSKNVMVDNTAFHFDEKNRIFCSPCYMMESSLTDVAEGIDATISAMVKTL